VVDFDDRLVLSSSTRVVPGSLPSEAKNIMQSTRLYAAHEIAERTPSNDQ